MAGAIPPQFLKNAKAKSAPTADASKGDSKLPPWLNSSKGSTPPKLDPKRKKKARAQAIADMQKKDAVLDSKLGPNDKADKASGGKQPPWLKGK